MNKNSRVVIEQPASPRTRPVFSDVPEGGSALFDFSCVHASFFHVSMDLIPVPVVMCVYLPMQQHGDF